MICVYCHVRGTTASTSSVSTHGCLSCRARVPYADKISWPWRPSCPANRRRRRRGTKARIIIMPTTNRRPTGAFQDTSGSRGGGDLSLKRRKTPPTRISLWQPTPPCTIQRPRCFLLSAVNIPYMPDLCVRIASDICTNYRIVIVCMHSYFISNPCISRFSLISRCHSVFQSFSLSVSHSLILISWLGKSAPSADFLYLWLISRCHSMFQHSFTYPYFLL